MVPTDLKVFEFDFCLFMGLKDNGQRNFICVCVFYAFCNFHLGRVTHICIPKMTIIGSDNGLSPGRRQAII